MNSNKISNKSSSVFERLYGRPLSDEEVTQARTGLAQFLKLLVRIDRRLIREENNHDHN